MDEFFRNIAEVVNWEVFLMGIVFLLVGAGISWLMVRSCWLGLSNSLSELHVCLRTYVASKKTALVVLAFLVVTYYLGIMVNTFCDVWIDNEKWHGYATRLPGLLLGQPIRTDAAIKVRVFENVYPEVPPPPDHQIIALYYHAKNVLWKDERWHSYMLYSQKMINVARVWAFSFFVVSVFGALGIAIRVARGVRQGRRDWPYWRAALASLGASVVAVLFYCLGLVVWSDNEREMDSKVFGIYRTEHGVAPSSVSTVQTAPFREVTPLDVAVFEPSGVAYRDGHVFTVNDKDDVVRVFDAAFGRPVTEFTLARNNTGGTRSKFEALARDETADTFYAIGAFFKTEYKRAVRFTIDDRFTVGEVRELDLSNAIAEARPAEGRSSVEGLVVSAGSSSEVSLLVGIRTEPEVTATTGFRLARIVVENDVGRLTESILLEHKTRRTDDGFPVHLSDLFGSGHAVFVLASSEDEHNDFHGNRIYCFDLRSRRQLWETREFAPRQKAEGITLWESLPGLRSAAIVFDNDFESTRMRGTLLLGPVPSALDQFGVPGFVQRWRTRQELRAGIK